MKKKKKKKKKKRYKYFTLRAIAYPKDPSSAYIKLFQNDSKQI